MTTDSTVANLEVQQQEAKAGRDAHTVEIVQWHFHPSTGSPFWLEKKAELDLNLYALYETLCSIKCYHFI